jgi:hypothetical protein
MVGPRADPTKKPTRTHYANLCFCTQGDLRHIVRCVRVVKRRHTFSCSGGLGSDPTKSEPGQVKLNLCVLDPVGTTGHVVGSGASGVRNIDALFFMQKH